MGGALSALSRGAELPITKEGDARNVGYRYHTSQGQTIDATTDELPTAWPSTCLATSNQSPIDIVTSSAKEESTNPGEIMLIGHDVVMTGMVLNDGRQIYFTPETNDDLTKNQWGKPVLYGGPLSSSKSYVFDHLEFKFGTDDAKGSEHTLDGKQYPMEIQMVFYDQTTHKDAATAGGHANADSVCVLSYFVETDTTDNTALADIITAVEDEATFVPYNADDGDVTKAGKSFADTDSKKLKLKDLLGDIDTVKDYYYYAGSQTSSDCTQNVKWIIATDMLKISTTQLDYFQALNDENSASTFVAPNFRAIKTNSIDVMHRKDETKKSEIFEEAATILGSTLLGIGTFGTVLNILQNDATAKALESNPILELIEDFDKKFLNGEEEQQSHQQFQPQQFQQRY